MKTAVSNPKIESPSLNEFHRLLDLIGQGKLFALQAWIAAGNPLRPSGKDLPCPNPFLPPSGPV